MASVHYGDLRPEQFLERIKKAPIGYLPLGTLEWHGYHMPLGADYIQSEHVMVQLAEEVGGVVFPPLFLAPDITDGEDHYGMDICAFEEGHAQKLPGSAYYVPEELFGAILKQTVLNAQRAGIQVMVVHGHGPSTNYVENHRTEFPLPLYSFFDLAYQEEEGIQTDHAAANETSITMAINPSLVDLSAIGKYGFPVASWGKDPRVHASREKGLSLIGRNVEKATESLRKLLENLPQTEEQNLHFQQVKNLLG